MSKIVHISQPRIYPHITYLDNISKSDLFVISDDLVVNKSSFEIRNRYFCKLSKQPKYINIPIEKKDVFKDLIISDLNYARSHRDILTHSYKDYPFFDKEILMLLIPDAKSVWFMDQFLDTIVNITTLLGIKSEFRLGSEVGSKRYKVSRIEEILNYYGASSYLSGQGGSDYLYEMSIPYIISSHDEKLFNSREGDSTYYMIADTIFSKGIEGVKSMLCKL